MLRANLHLVLHVVVPAAVAFRLYRGRFLNAWLIMMATTLVDLDHLLADPVYDPARCSLGFHPLHRYPLIVAYAMAALWPRLRLVGTGLLIHMALDGMDCVWMQCEAR